MSCEIDIRREERDSFLDAYESDWLRVFQNESGPKNFDDDSSPYDIFCRFFYAETIGLLVEQTNLYYEQFLVSKGGIVNLPRGSRARAWKPVTVPEMKVFLAFVLYMGLVRMPNYDVVVIVC